MTKAELAALLDEREAAARRNESITLTKAELDELLSAAEAKANAQHAADLRSNGAVTHAEDRTSG